MGHIYILAGPSGVGKTTLLREIMGKNLLPLKILPRLTTREPRKGEQTNAHLKDYYFSSEESFWRGLAANTYLPYYEAFENNYYGIHKPTIENALADEGSDSIVTSGINGAIHLKEMYNDKVTILYMYTGDEHSILLPALFNNPPTEPEIEELIRRLNKKHADHEYELDPGYKDAADYIRKRMAINYAELGCVVGKINEKIKEGIRNYINILVNEKDQIGGAIEKFRGIIEESSSKHRTNQRSTGNGNETIPTDKSKKPKRTQDELKILIEAAVDTHGDKKTNKFYAKCIKVEPSRLSEDPYKTFLAEAKKKYRAEKKAGEGAQYTMAEYDDDRGGRRLKDIYSSNASTSEDNEDDLDD